MFKIFVFHRGPEANILDLVSIYIFFLVLYFDIGRCLTYLFLVAIKESNTFGFRAETKVLGAQDFEIQAF